MKRLETSKFRASKLFLTLCLLVLGAGDASAVLIKVEGNYNTWLPVDRPEQLTLTSWNTPIESIPEPIVPPESENVPSSVFLSDPETFAPVFELEDDYYGWLDLEVTGLAPGQTVLVERFLVREREGLPDELALRQSFLITDGALRPVGDGFNTNLPNDVSTIYTSGDPTEQDGSVLAQINFYEPSASTIVGEYLFRVSSPPASAANPSPLQYTPLEYPFSIVSAEDDAPQGLTGSVLSNGVPVPDAMVVKVWQLSGYADMLSGVTTDASGGFTLPSEERNEFDFLAIKEGYVGKFGEDMAVNLEDDVFTDRDLELEEGTQIISGTLKDSDTGTPLPGVEMFFLETSAEGEFISRNLSVAWTDADGNFSASVTPGIWGIIVRPETAYTMGYVTSAENPMAIADVTSGHVTGLEVGMARATALITGKLTNEISAELFGVKIIAINDQTGAGVIGVTDGAGDYQLGVTPGVWRVFPFSYSLEDIDHSGFNPVLVDVPGEGFSVEHDITAREAVADIYGEAYNASTGEPIGRLRIRALNKDLDVDEQVTQYTFETDGEFSIFVPEGDWRVIPDPREAARRSEKLIFVGDIDVFVPFSSFWQEIEKEIRAYTVNKDTPVVRLTLTDSETSDPIAGPYLHAYALVNGDVHHSFAEIGADGMVDIPVRFDGPTTWNVHVSTESLNELGKKEIPEFTVTVDSALTEVSITTESFENPPIQGSVEMTDDGIKFTSGAETGRGYFIEASSDLENWRTMGRVRGVGGEIRLFDETAPETDRRFYRLAPEVTVAPAE